MIVEQEPSAEETDQSERNNILFDRPPVALDVQQLLQDSMRGDTQPSQLLLDLDNELLQQDEEFKKAEDAAAPEQDGADDGEEATEEVVRTQTMTWQEY